VKHLFKSTWKGEEDWGGGTRLAPRATEEEEEKEEEASERD